MNSMPSHRPTRRLAALVTALILLLPALSVFGQALSPVTFSLAYTDSQGQPLQVDAVAVPYEGYPTSYWLYLDPQAQADPEASLIILDVTLPDMSGYELCTRLRAMPYADRTPILFLSGQHGAQHVAQALDCGGDDYLRKPFAMRELNARIRALLRRAKFDEPAGSAPELRLSPADNSVEIDGRHIVLTRTEFQLLRYLCENANRHHTASQLLESLWNYPPGRGDTALVRNHVRNLRRKIEHDPDRPSIIISSHGRGYTVNACLSS